MPAARLLVDTGVLYAALDATDNWHEVCAPLLRSAPRPLVTTQAVLAELFWMLGSNIHDLRNGWRLVRSGVLTLAEITDKDLLPIQDLMLRYADRPMDLADATLVHVAEREGIHAILTIDHADFEIYRIGLRRRFTVLPPRRAGQ